MSKDKCLTNLSIDELKAKILPKPHKPFSIDGLPVFLIDSKELLPEEEFKKHPELHVEVSNLGRIRYNEEILLQLPDLTNNSPYGYLQVRFKERFRKANFLVYRLVAETWCERPDSNYNIVHHITNNGMDNRATNLLWVTKEQHNQIHFYK
jgi:hypothetical protein